MTRYRINNNEMKVKIFQDEYHSFMATAIDKSQRYKTIAKDNSPYGFNHPHSHIVGLVSEHASLLLFRGIEENLGTNFNIDAVFQDNTRDSECDLVVCGTRIEVKGIKYKSWLEYGPCISTSQYFRIKKKADIILWGLYNEKQNEVTFKGYNTVRDISRIKPVLTGPEGKQIMNYKVLDIMKPLDKLQF